jgi:hypothetical protein
VKTAGSFVCFNIYVLSRNGNTKDSALCTKKSLLHKRIETQPMIREEYADTARKCWRFLSHIVPVYHLL